MAIEVTYNKIWKWVAVDWATLQTFYGADFNPNVNLPSSFTSITVVDETTSFNLSGFQPWHEVGCWVIRLDNTGSSDYTGYLRAYFYRDNSWWSSWQYDYGNITIEAWWWWSGYIYFWVDYDEIWSWYSTYKIEYSLIRWGIIFDSPTFTQTWLSIDSTRYPSWYIRVEWANLCFIDGVQWTTWYKHKIAFDSSYSTNVWSDNAWYIRLDDTDLLRIYYVDEFWNRRRTYPSRERYWGNVNVWSNNKWYMRVSSSWDAEEWYAHLCFIAPNWSKRRILNWPPIWYS